MNHLNLIVLLLTAYVAVFVEAYLGGARSWLGVQVDLLPALMVYCGLSCGIAPLAITAVLAGFWFDTLSANPLGISILPQFLVGWIVSLTRDVILRDEPSTRFFLGAAGSALAPFLTVLLLWGGGYKPLIGWGSLWQWLILTLGGGLLTPVFFWLFDHLNSALAYRRTSETTFRSDREIKRGRN